MSREPIACPHRPPCPGCPRLGETALPEAARAVYQAIAARAAQRTPPFVLGPAQGFRHRARLSVRGRANSPKIGIFQQGSHRIVDIPRCLVHHPRINEVAGEIKQAIRRTGTRPYADAPHAGDLRGVQIVVERESQRVQLTLIGNADRPDPLAALIETVGDALGDRLHSLFWNGHPARSNVILGPHWQRITGPEAVRESIAGAAVYYPPGAFGQSHLALAEALSRDLARRVPDGARIAEFYAGCGAIGLGLAQRASHITMNEIGEASLAGLAMGIAALDDETRARVDVAPGAAEDALRLLENADVVIVDPPRRGLDAGLLAALIERPPEQLHYVSCGIASFSRDLHALLDAGRLRLREWSAYASFRHTEHVETRACFERVGA